MLLTSFDPATAVRTVDQLMREKHCPSKHSLDTRGS